MKTISITALVEPVNPTAIVGEAAYAEARAIWAQMIADAIISGQIEEMNKMHRHDNPAYTIRDLHWSVQD